MSRSPRFLVACASACAAAFLGLMALAYFVQPARWLDADALDGFGALWRPQVSALAHYAAHVCDPFPYAIAVVVLLGITLAARGARTAAAVGMLLVGANVSSQVLKPLLAHHRELYYTEWHLNNIHDASFPSGHATAAMALSLAVLIMAPRAYRPLAAALGALATVAISFSILMLGWHFPSDIVGGYLVASAWGLVSVAALRHANARWPQGGTMRAAAREAVRAPSGRAIAVAALVLGVAACVLAASRAQQVAGFADRHTAFVAVAGAIAVAATLLLVAAAALATGSGGSTRRRGTSQ